MIATENTRLWKKKVVNPYFTDIKRGIKTFDIRFADGSFPVAVGDWVMFRRYDKNGYFEKQVTLKAVNYVLNLAEVPFYKQIGKTVPLSTSWTIIQLTDPQCPKCEHEITAYYDVEEGYETTFLECDNPECKCECDVEIGLVYSYMCIHCSKVVTSLESICPERGIKPHQTWSTADFLAAHKIT